MTTIFTLQKLFPYFFTFELLNYAGLTPADPVQMFNLKENDTNTWNV